MIGNWIDFKIEAFIKLFYTVDRALTCVSIEIAGRTVSDLSVSYWQVKKYTETWSLYTGCTLIIDHKYNWITHG